jgi:hypothetical protein
MRKINILLVLCTFLTMILHSQNRTIQTSPNSITEKSIEKIDKAMLSVKGNNDSTILWINAKQLTIEGMGWKDDIEDYTRLQNKVSTLVTADVWSLSRHSSGISVRFNVKGTKILNARWTLRGKYRTMLHMTSQAINGLDLYVKQNNKWIWAGLGKPESSGQQHEAQLFGGFDSNKTYECMVYLPLYNGISTLNLGFSKGATVNASVPLKNKPFVFYGSSILQGCSASRTGMAFASMLGRKFESPVVNFGFSGNGFMEENFGEIMGQISASIYFIDCLPNMGKYSLQETTDRTLKLVRKIRILQPTTPIVLIEDGNRPVNYLRNSPVINNKRIGLKSAFEILIKETNNIYYVEGNKLLGDDNEATVDGTHPSDLGMYHYFNVLEPITAKILNSK